MGIAFPSNMHFDSASSMKTILDLHFPTGAILDVNFGHGVFYKKVDREVIGIDVRSTGNVIADNRHLPFDDDQFALGVCDPPYKRGPGDQKYTERYGNAPYTTKRVTQQYFDLLPELVRVCKSGMIIKAQDDTDGHRFNCRMFALMSYVKELTGLDPHDVFYLVRRGVMDNNISGRQRHFAANLISYFLVYRWATKSPFKPIRF